ncbi:aminotransferase class V-fold PLP-dependent enzyme [Aquimarina sp. BL5]|uniref:aminotransferase class V-fold PLP-dependent enzyme n=1 Tax=Aquimarina sp. BL5 TaxID=1714860 RepID=UPI000E52328F|nr:aminotransferase class V-fold PLP-dependent enzyme [Aquimarina sp. BL5]AXT51265.1 aminotransferase class V-fold PLP-dependent enzyme [Aquimarina sp. BL5]RKN09476.1 aminotransferase class V-fold PLP-dependent enzyme [Aquimarina sp. BL5]
MKNLRKEFPVLSQNTYLNTASSGLLYDSLLEYRQEHDLDFLIGGSIFRDKQQDFLNSVRKSVGDFFGYESRNTILTPNFSLGFNTILNGLEKNKKVLLLDEDYPSVNFSVINKGFKICYAEVNASLEQNIEEAIAKHAPDVFAFSLVQYINGIAVDLNFLKQLKLKNPDLLLIADGTQFCGTKVFNFNTSGIDILGCSGYKWLLGGYGNGFILFKEGVLDQITPENYKKAADDVDYDSSYTSSQARYECGHLDTFSFGSLLYSLEFLSKIGLSVIEEHVNELSNYAKTELANLNLLEKDVLERNNHSSIFNIKGDQKLFTSLKEKNIITSLRGGGIRISLHFYNTIQDIDKLLANI